MGLRSSWGRHCSFCWTRLCKTARFSFFPQYSNSCLFSVSLVDIQAALRKDLSIVDLLYSLHFRPILKLKCGWFTIFQVCSKVIHICISIYEPYIYILFQIFFYYRLLQDNKYNPLCYTVVSYYLFHIE